MRSTHHNSTEARIRNVMERLTRNGQTPFTAAMVAKEIKSMATSNLKRVLGTHPNAREVPDTTGGTRPIKHYVYVAPSGEGLDHENTQ